MASTATINDNVADYPNVALEIKLPVVPTVFPSHTDVTDCRPIVEVIFCPQKITLTSLMTGGLPHGKE
jgi:hypothetical protein